MRLWVFKRHFSTIFQLYIDLGATFPGANMVQGKNTLGYLRTRTFYRKESTFTNTHRSQNVWHIHLEKCKKKYPLSRPTKMSDQIVGLRECWLSNLSDILGGICRIWEFDRWYTWSVLYIVCTCTMWNSLHIHSMRRDIALQWYKKSVKIILDMNFVLIRIM